MTQLMIRFNQERERQVEVWRDSINKMTAACARRRAAAMIDEKAATEEEIAWLEYKRDVVVLALNYLDERTQECERQARMKAYLVAQEERGGA